MGVEVSRLSNGLTVATETLPNIESVALGVWVKSGARNERDDEHGMAHLLEHMAFKGTSTAQRLRRSPRRSRMSAARSTPPPASRRPPSTPACSATTCRWPSTSSPTSCTEFEVRRRRARARAARDPAGDRRRARHARRHRLRPLHRDGLPPPDDRPLDPRHAGDGQILHLAAAARLHRPAIRRRAHGRGRGRRHQARRFRARGREAGSAPSAARPTARCRNTRNMSAATSARTAT